MTSEARITAVALNLLPLKPGDTVRMISVDDDDPAWLVGATGTVESIQVTADPDDWQCLVCFDVRDKHILLPDDDLEVTIYDLLLNPPNPLPDELPIYETTRGCWVYMSQLEKLEGAS